MIGKMIGELILAAAVLHIMPVDAQSLAFEAGVTETPAPITVSRLLRVLPTSADRVIPPRKVDTDSYGILVNARSAIVVDDVSGAVLYEKSPDEVRAIGSITKLVTILTFLSTNPDLEARVTIQSEDYVPGGRVYLRFDDSLALRDVLRASLVGSDNTATAALARFSGLSREDFVTEMHNIARTIGMTSSHFADPSGVGAENLSTARDIATLIAAAEAHPILADIMPQSNVTVRQASGYEVEIASTNGMLETYLAEAPYGVLAGKTGYIPQAGYCLTTVVEYGRGRVRVVVLGADSKNDRVRDAKGLAAWAFKTFAWE